MLLKKLLQETSASPNIMFRDPFKAIEHEALVKEVIGLANVEFEGPRYIVFGVNKATMEGSGYVGIPADQLANLKKAHRLVSMLVKPMVDLSFIFDELDGRTIGALEIDGCIAPPYVVRRNFSDELVRGRSYIRAGRDIQQATDADIQKMSATTEQSKEWNVCLGLGEDHECEFLEMKVPDSSNPPSLRIKQEIEGKFDWKQATVEAIGTINTSIFKRVTGKFRRMADPADSEEEALALFKEAAERSAADADNYYLFEQNAGRLQLTLRNEDATDLHDVKVTIALPVNSGFSVVDRVYSNPDDKPNIAEASRYPAVRAIKNGFVVTANLSTVSANSSRAVFATPLRLAVGREMNGKKIAINYSLQGANKEPVERGRLKIRFTVAEPIATREDNVDQSRKPAASDAAADGNKPATGPALPAAEPVEIETSTIVLDDMDADAIVEADAARKSARTA